jgi:uncharacterized protein (TIGR02265 family)
MADNLQPPHSSEPLPETLIFAPAVEALFRHALAGRLSAPALARLREIGLDLDKPLMPGYPRSQWYLFVRIAAEDVFADRPFEVAQVELGRLMIEGFRQTRMGKALLDTLKIYGPLRTLRRMDKNLRAVRNLGETRIRELGHNDYELWINNSRTPHLMQGMVLGLMQASEPSVVLELIGHDDRSATYRVRW